MRRALIILFILSSLLLTSCSTKLAYNFMDWAIEWKIKGLVSLHGPQKEQMKLAVDRFHRWHRNTQLPEYADYLQQLAVRIEGDPITPKEIHAETDKVQLLVDQSIERALPSITSVLAQLDERQVQELLNSVVKKRQQYVEDYVDISPKKQAEKRYDDFVDYFKPWVGSLDRTQKEAIRRWSESLLPFETLNVEQQKLWERRLGSILENRKEANLDTKLRELMFYRTDNWLPELEKVLDQNQAQTYQLIAQLVNGLSDKQKRHLLDELRDYAQICRELSAEGR